MRVETITKELYQFSELSDSAKENAVNECSEFNVMEDWWTYSYEDAEKVDLKISGFDCDRGQSIDLAFIYNPIDTANQIIKDHGPTCETFKLSKVFISEYEVLSALIEVFEQLNNDFYDDNFSGEIYDVVEKYADQLEFLEDEFLKDLSNEYLSILSQEYDYLTSEDAIIELIDSNGYEFSIDGKF